MFGYYCLLHSVHHSWGMRTRNYHHPELLNFLCTESRKSRISSSSTAEQGITILSSGDPDRAPENGHITEFLPGKLITPNFQSQNHLSGSHSDFEEYGWYEKLNGME